MSPDRLVFRAHALRRMFQRRITEIDVRDAIEHGETIEEYSTDEPYPSRLVLGGPAGRPLHVVIAENAEANEAIVVTVYEPDLQRWEAGFRRRRKP